MRALAILSLFLLTACGQAGDLYLPDHKAAQPQQPAPPAPPGTVEQQQNKKDQK